MISQDGTLAVESILSHLPGSLLDILLCNRPVAIEALLQAHCLSFLGLYGNRRAVCAASPKLDYLESLLETHLAGAVQGDIRVLEVNILHFVDRSLPVFRNLVEAQHGAEDAACGCRVAVGIVAATGGNVDGTVEIAVAIEQADYYIGTVDDSIYIESGIESAGAADVVAILLISQCPGDVPVVRILLPPLDHICHTFVVFTLGRNGLEGFLDDKGDIVGDESEGIHGSHIHSAVPSIAVVHDMADLVGIFNGAVHHTRGHYTGVVCLDLEVDIICVGIVLPMAGFGGHDALENVIASLKIGMPERISCIGEGLCKGFDRGI